MGDSAEQDNDREEIGNLVGKTVAGRYHIQKLLGEGGMGVVYSAIDTRLEKAVAIKLLKDDFAHRKDVVARFTQEAKSAARIKHENVMDVTDYGQTEHGTFYIAMEMLSGIDLADLLKKDRRISLERAVNIMIQVGRALSAAHAKGVVHRDLKPENIFLVKGDDGRDIVKIVDFGIAQMKDAGSDGRKLTQTGMVFGTPEYMSPEQAQGKPIDHRVDIYALGVIMYEVFVGNVPFEADNFMATLSKQMFEQAPPIREARPDTDITPDVEKIVEKAMAKDPEHRYANMQEFVDDLIRAREGLKTAASSEVIPGPSALPLSNTTAPFRAATTTSAHPAMTAEMPVAQTSRSNKGLLVGGVFALLAVGVGVGVFMKSNTSNANNAAANVTPGPAAPAATVDAGAPGQQAIATAPNNTAKPAAVDAGAPVAMQAPDAGPPLVVPPPAAAKVTLTITSGANAKVQVDGRPEINCSGSPCSITVPRGEEVKLVATAGKRHGEVTLTPDQDGQAIAITLIAPVASPNVVHTGTNPRPHTSGGSHGPRCRPGQTSVPDPDTGLLVPCRIFNR